MLGDGALGELALGETITPTTMRWLRPGADDTDGTWTNQAASATDLYATIDESSPNDSDYIQSASSPTNDLTKIRLSDPTVGVDTSLPIKVRYRVWANTADEEIDLVINLVEGSTVRATWTETLTTTPTTTERTLTGGEAASITDWTNLYLEFDASVVAAAGSQFMASSIYVNVTGTRQFMSASGAYINEA
jgi:hypothetical protein